MNANTSAHLGAPQVGQVADDHRAGRDQAAALLEVARDELREVRLWRLAQDEELRSTNIVKNPRTVSAMSCVFLKNGLELITS